ncbi:MULTISPECIES: hypothetical protein [unclassified Achromobacter]|uniref:hypothetical protein n=1 Tax=unclassified Achromobacter TaxID=2626865 RepID=UPI000B517CB6|nr:MULTISPECIES: hypothetical protein [unclassified Achromobacter]OWT69191.1 hypothetical protein CEY05_28605 [Achromobacter sp. HZ34]OWT70596.1 hypothetical protein CEY04_27435 [Achromobacter sp. HZ28]
MIRRSMCACSAALGFVLLAGCVYTPPADKMERYTNSMVGKNLAEVVSRFGPEDHQGGSATNPNIGTPQNPRYGHTWSRYGSTQHQRFVQTGTESTGKTLVTVLPAGGGQGERPVYQDNTAPTGYYTQQGETCRMFFETDANKNIVYAELLGDYCDKLFLSGG